MIYKWFEEAVTLSSGEIHSIWRAETKDYTLSVRRIFDKERNRFRWLWQCARYHLYGDTGYSSHGLIGHNDGTLAEAMRDCQQAHASLTTATA